LKKLSPLINATFVKVLNTL